MFKVIRKVDISPHKSERGEGILSMMLGSVAFVLVAVLVYNMFSSTLDSNKISSHVTGMNQMGPNIERMYASMGQRDFTGLAAVDLVATNAIPNEWKTTPTVTNEWNGNVVFTGTVGSFTITDPSVPKGSCSEIAISLMRMYGVTVGATNVTNMATANVACASVLNTLTLTYPKP